MWHTIGHCLESLEAGVNRRVHFVVSWHSRNILWGAADDTNGLVRGSVEIKLSNLLVMCLRSRHL